MLTNASDYRQQRFRFFLISTRSGVRWWVRHKSLKHYLSQAVRKAILVQVVRRKGFRDLKKMRDREEGHVLRKLGRK